jgi:hypothetical protein
LKARKTRLVDEWIQRARVRGPAKSGTGRPLAREAEEAIAKQAELEAEQKAKRDARYAARKAKRK